MLRLLSPTVLHQLSSSNRGLLSLLHSQLLHSSTASSRMDLKTIVSKLEEIAPSKLAESWDNVGLLVEPVQTGLINRILLTNDLTEQVMDETENLLGEKVGLILSYHPPIFRPLKRLTQTSAKERLVLRAVQSGMAVYSPHTSLDPLINDWLLSGLGEGDIASLAVGKIASRLKNEIHLCGVTLESVLDFIGPMACRKNIVVTPNHDGGRSGVTVLCKDTVLTDILPKLKKQFPGSEISIEPNEKFEVYPRGGKRLTLSQPLPLSQLVTKVKQHLNLSHIRLATPHYSKGEDPQIKTVATCAGSGGGVLSGVKADLFLTGEMSHHEVLEASSHGTAVILCEHSNTERGFLQQIYKKQLETELEGQVEIVVAKCDRDPLQIV